MDTFTPENKNEFIIFLDIDGVLNCEKDYIVIDQNYSRFAVPKYEDNLNPDLIANLNELIKETGATVVVHSMWRLSLDKDKLNALLRKNGLCVDIKEVTNIRIENRWDSILDYFSRVPFGTKCIIIDDEVLREDLADTLYNIMVQTSFEDGFTQEKLEEARKICKEFYKL